MNVTAIKENNNLNGTMLNTWSEHIRESTQQRDYWLVGDHWKERNTVGGQSHIGMMVYQSYMRNKSFISLLG